MLLEENQVITTIPSIGNILGAIIIGEIGNIARFESASKLVAFAGLDVSVKQSGEFIGTQKQYFYKRLAVSPKIYKACCQPCHIR